METKLVMAFCLLNFVDELVEFQYDDGDGHSFVFSIQNMSSFS